MKKKVFGIIRDEKINLQWKKFTGKMKSKKLFLIFSLIILFSIFSTISASRLPTVGGDDTTWGTILNDYLTNLSGANATELNLTMVNGTNIYSSAINTTHLLDGSITDTDISNITNMTLGEKITFTLGEIIDNIVDGWIRITGNLQVDGDVNVTGSINASGNATIIGNYICNATRCFSLQDLNTSSAGGGGDFSFTDFHDSFVLNSSILNNTKNIQELLNSTGIYSTPLTINNTKNIQLLLNGTNMNFDNLNVSGNGTFDSNYLCNKSVCFSFQDLNTSSAGGGGDFSFTDFHDSFVLNASILNNTKNIQLLLNDSGIYETYNATYENYEENVSRNNTLETYNTYDTRWYQVLWDATFNESFDDRDKDFYHSIWNSTFNASFDDKISGIVLWDATFNESGDSRWALNTTAGIQYLINETGIYETYNATYDTYSTNVSTNWTKVTVDTFNTTWFDLLLIQSVNTTNNLQLLLNSTGIYSTPLTINNTKNIQELLNSTGIYSTPLTINNTKNIQELLNGTNINFNNINATGNVTLAQKITFALGEIIDNILDGWITITGSLIVAGDVNVTGHLNVTGNITTNDTICLNTGCSAKIYYNGSGIIISS